LIIWIFFTLFFFILFTTKLSLVNSGQTPEPKGILIGLVKFLLNHYLFLSLLNNNSQMRSPTLERIKMPGDLVGTDVRTGKQAKPAVHTILTTDKGAVIDLTTLGKDTEYKQIKKAASILNVRKGDIQEMLERGEKVVY
jgi:hypothetical protein